MAQRLTNPREIQQRLRARKISQSKVAAGIGISKAALSLVLHGKQTLTIDIAKGLAKAIQMPVSEVMRHLGQTISDPWEYHHRVVGFVGAGDEVILDDMQGAGEHLDEIQAPFMGYSGQVVQIRGASMAPRYLDGEYVAYSENSEPTSLIGREVIARTVDGRMYLKRLQKGSKNGRYTMVSLNPVSAPIIDVELEWAASIDWHLPTR